MFYYGTKDGKNYGGYDETSGLKSYVECSDWISIVEKANGSGKIILPDSEGNPVLSDPSEPTEDEKTAIEISTLKRKLSETDYITCKIAEGSATVDEYSQKIAERRAWRAQIEQLQSSKTNAS